MPILVLALLQLTLTVREEWIDRVQPDCGVLRVLAKQQAEDVRIHEELAAFEKDPAAKQRMLDELAGIRGPAEKRRLEYEKCTRTAPKVMTEEQAKREELAEQEAEFDRMVKGPHYPPGAIAPRPRSDAERRWDAEKQKILAKPANAKIIATSWSCWKTGPDLPKDEARQKGCEAARVKRILGCMKRSFMEHVQFGPKDPCQQPFERAALETER